jgi:hypothetical protein
MLSTIPSCQLFYKFEGPTMNNAPVFPSRIGSMIFLRDLAYTVHVCGQDSDTHTCFISHTPLSNANNEPVHASAGITVTAGAMKDA